jgi:hypothetical protein
MIESLTQINTNYFFDRLRQINFSVHSIVAREPYLKIVHSPYIYWNQYKKKQLGMQAHESIVNEQTELVIDGFQGSANSFATVAFKQSQTRPVFLSHHLHSPNQIIQAVKNDIPVLLTVREPEGAVLSLTSRWYYISVESALKSYIGFYSKLKPYVDGCVISNFVQTTQHLDRTIEAINIRFNTNFDLINLEIAKTKSRQAISDQPDIYHLKQQLKHRKKTEFNLAKNQALVETAYNLYQEYEQIAQLQSIAVLNQSRS